MNYQRSRLIFDENSVDARTQCAIRKPILEFKNELREMSCKHFTILISSSLAFNFNSFPV